MPRFDRWAVKRKRMTAGPAPMTAGPVLPPLTAGPVPSPFDRWAVNPKRMTAGGSIRSG